MKRSLTTRLSFVLLLCLSTVCAMPTLAEEAPPAPGPRLQRLPTQQELASMERVSARMLQSSLERIFTPAPDLKAGGPEYCNYLNIYPYLYCLYRWNYSTECCVAYWTAPGASCGPKCP